MRESLRATLGNQAFGPPSHHIQANSRQQQQPSTYQTSQSQRRGGSSQNHVSSRGGWGSAELSGSFGRAASNQNGMQVPSTTPTSAHFFHSGSMERKGRLTYGASSGSGYRAGEAGCNPSSMTFSDSSSSNNSNSSFGTGTLQAPANTPMQTPVESEGLENRYYAAATIGRDGEDETMIQDNDQQSNYQNQNHNDNESGGGGTFTRKVVGGFDGGFNNRNHNQSHPVNGFEVSAQNA